MTDKYITQYTEETSPSSTDAVLLDQGAGAYVYSQISKIFANGLNVGGDLTISSTGNQNLIMNSTDSNDSYIYFREAGVNKSYIKHDNAGQLVLGAGTGTVAIINGAIVPQAFSTYTNPSAACIYRSSNGGGAFPFDSNNNLVLSGRTNGDSRIAFTGYTFAGGGLSTMLGIYHNQILNSEGTTVLTFDTSENVTTANDLTVGGDLDVEGDLITTTKTPASAGAAGTAGTIAWDADYIYVCTATNTWKRVAIATW